MRVDTWRDGCCEAAPKVKKKQRKQVQAGNCTVVGMLRTLATTSIVCVLRCVILTYYKAATESAALSTFTSRRAALQ